MVERWQRNAIFSNYVIGLSSFISTYFLRRVILEFFLLANFFHKWKKLSKGKKLDGHSKEKFFFNIFGQDQIFLIVKLLFRFSSAL